MNHERVVQDISSSPELLGLVEEIEQSGAELVLVRGGEELALVTQLPSNTKQALRQRKGQQPERVLDIIGIGASNQGSDIARLKDHYIANAVDRQGK